MRDGEEPLPANQLVQRPWRGEAGKGGGSGWRWKAGGGQVVKNYLRAAALEELCNSGKSWQSGK